MTTVKIFVGAFIGLSVLSCNPKAEVNIENVALKAVDSPKKIQPPAPPTGLRVSANLVYDDSTLSSFDVLNDKTKALWNTIGGAGDAEKPSTKTRVAVTGKLDGLRLKIINGKKKVVDQLLPNFSGEFDAIVDNTGCQILKVFVLDRNRIVFNDSVEYHCGE